VRQVNHEADAAAEALRISVDTNATGTVGPFARGGTSRAKTHAADHDCQPEAMVTPVGIVVPTSDTVFLYGVLSKVTSDCLADCLTQWWASVRERFRHLNTLVSNLDNGSENHSRHTPFMQRMVDVVRHYRLYVRLASDPPSHSQYNPIERCWGILDNHWNGALLDSIETVLACSMVTVRVAAYSGGVLVAKEARQNKYPPAKPEVLRLLAPQRGLTAIAKSKPQTEKTTNGRLPELSNFGSPPAEPWVIPVRPTVALAAVRSTARQLIGGVLGEASTVMAASSFV
jgi:hypothetical protein